MEELVLSKLHDHLQKQMLGDDEEFILAFKADDIAIKKAAIIRLVEKITVHVSKISIQLKDGFCLSIDYRFSVPGPHRQLISGSQSGVASENQKQTLLKAFLQGYVWRKQLFEGKVQDIASIAKAENKNERYIARMINFSLLAPDLVLRILKGDILAHISSETFTRDLSIAWDAQRALF